MTESPEHNFTNREIADLLDGVSARLQIIGANRFRIAAFQNAAESIRQLTRDVKSYYRDNKLEDIPGVGEGIAGALRNVFSKGGDPEFDALFAQIPQGVTEMLAVPELGPKSVKRLWEELSITTIAQLQNAAEEGKLRGLKGFGAKTEERILHGIAQIALRGDERMPLGIARPLALTLVASLQDAMPPDTISRIEIGGSLRRWQETIGDIDLICISENPQLVMETFRSLPDVAEVIGAGDTKSSVVLHNGMQVDIRVMERKHWGAALLYFTGNKEHNIAVREIALRRGWSLNEYCLTATGKGKGRDAAEEGEQRFFEEEAELYEFLDLAYVEPEMRQNRGEIEAARNGTLPRLIEAGDLRGEFHSHTTWSDGKKSVAEMAERAREKGYAYWNVSDHSIGLGVVQGVDGNRLLEQRKEIDAANEAYARDGVDFRVLQGSEVEIMADGSLGLTDEVMATLDVVVASIHSAQRQDRETITARCLNAVNNPHVDILGHPTSRLIGSRPPTELDVERVLEACAATGTAVEINANPHRLDLKDVYARRAVELGCKVVINCDAHSFGDMELLEYGIGTARRGWITPDDVVNTRPLREALLMFKDKKVLE